MKTIALLFTLFAAIAVSWSAHAQTPGTSDTLNSSSATNSAATNQDDEWIIFKDVPITTAIDNLARAADINYILATNLFQVDEPVVTFRLKNISAKETLNRMLNLRKLVLNEDSVTHIARITRMGGPTNTLAMTLLALEANNLAFFTNDTLTKIEFQDVPLDTALDKLVQASGGKISFGPSLEKAANGKYVVKNGVTVSGSRFYERFDPMPLLTIHWTNVSPLQSIIAFCENLDLAIVKNETNGMLQIKLKDDQSHP